MGAAMTRKLGEEPFLHEGAKVLRSTLGRYVEIGARSQVVETVVGDYSYMASDTDVISSTIGTFCSIAAHVRINPGNHPMERASQSHFTYRASLYFEDEPDEAAFFDWRRSSPVTIGHDVWIGHGAVILPGRSIGTGAVIAAGAIVTKDVAPYAIVVGNPARLLRMRFPADIVAGLQRVAWWEWDHGRLHAALADFRELSAEAFVRKHG